MSNEKAYKFSTRDDTTFRVEKSDGNCSVVVLNVEDGGTLDKTWQEILDGIIGGTIFVIVTASGDEAYMNIVTTAYTEGGSYIVSTITESSYSTDSADGYPTANVG